MNPLKTIDTPNPGLVTLTDFAMSLAEMTNRITLIRQAMEQVMARGVHYDVIPGTKKNSLLKPGSEVLLTLFRIASIPDRIDDLSSGDEIRYRVYVKGVHQPTGTVIGVGIGECSSREEKYMWRRPVDLTEFDLTDATMRRQKVKKSKYGDKTWTEQQVRTDAASLANTILKMAKKRAQVDMTLTATGASDVFTQDLEDEDDGDSNTSKRKPTQQPRPKSSPSDSGSANTAPTPDSPEFEAAAKAAPAPDGAIAMLRKKAEAATISESDICKAVGIAKLDDISIDGLNRALKFVSNPMGGGQ